MVYRTTRFVLLVLAGAAWACGSEARGAGSVDASGDNVGGGECPAQQPHDGDPCSGSASCQYGHSTCCGIAYSALTCKCQLNGYSCAQTVECNFACPGDAG
jgi:hypothetical protein